jgi:hypothetical protein
MATWEQLQVFARSHAVDGPGLYVVSTLPSAEPLIKVGYSKNVMTRVKQYRKNLGGQLRILGVARIPGNLGGDGRRPVKEAERIMLGLIGKDNIESRNEWVSGKAKDHALNSWALAHHAFTKDSTHGQALYTADEIVANRKQQPKSYDITSRGRVLETLPLTDLGGRQYTRLRRVLDKPW